METIPTTSRLLDRFYHIDAIQEDTDAWEEARCSGEAYNPIVLANGDSHKQLLARSRYLLFKPADKWTDSQKQRAELLFEACPDLEEPYSLTHSLRMIFSRNTGTVANIRGLFL